MQSKKLILAGANNPETLRLIDDINKSGKEKIEVLGWLDNDELKHGKDFCGFEVLGEFDILRDSRFDDIYIFNNITTDAKVRSKTTDMLSKYNKRFISLIHPSVNIKNVSLAEHVCIQEGAIVQSGVNISNNACIFSMAFVGHNCNIGKSVFIGARATIGGFTKINNETTIWMGATIGPRLKIGSNCIIGANALVLEDLESHTTIVSRPSMKIKKEKNE